MISQVAPLGADAWVRRVGAGSPVESAQPSGFEGVAANVAAAAPAASAQLLAGALVGQLQQLDPAAFDGPSAFAAARTAGAYGLASMPEVAALAPTAPKPALQEVSGLGFIPGEVFTSNDPAKLRAYLREEVAQARDLARQEQQLSDAAGVEVKLAYDPATERVVELSPGDAGYATLKGARDMFERMAWDLPKMGQNPRDYADLLKL